MAKRPKKYTSELAGLICEKMSEGLSLKSICTDDNMPLARTVYEWLEDNEQFRNNYARATEERAGTIFEEALEIADDGTNDWMVREGKDGATGWALNGEHVQRSRLRVDTRKWFLAKMLPKKFGEKITQEITGKDGGPVQTEDVNARDIVASRIAGIASRTAAGKDTSGPD